MATRSPLACTTPAHLPFLHKLLLEVPGAARATHKDAPVLCTACERGNLPAVHLLLLFGADVNAREGAGNGAGPLHIACNKGESRPRGTVALAVSVRSCWWTPRRQVTLHLVSLGGAGYTDIVRVLTGRDLLAFPSYAVGRVCH